jgi:hypothetical protein
VQVEAILQTEITLGRVAARLAMLEIGCRKCERYGRLRVARLIEQHGAEKELNGLLGTLEPRPRDSPCSTARWLAETCPPSPA